MIVNYISFVLMNVLCFNYNKKFLHLIKFILIYFLIFIETQRVHSIIINRSFGIFMKI